MPIRSTTARRSCLMLALVGSLLPTAPLHAEGYEARLRYGEAGPDYQAVGLSLRLPSQWSGQVGGWTMGLSPELEFTRFRYKGRPDTEHLNTGAALGLFRIERTGGSVRPFAEAGLGVAAFSRDHLGRKNFSTHYQFTEQVGLGVRFVEHWSLAWRYAHYSNADIETPNDGIDLHQLSLGFSF